MNQALRSNQIDEFKQLVEQPPTGVCEKCYCDLADFKLTFACPDKFYADKLAMWVRDKQIDAAVEGTDTATGKFQVVIENKEFFEDLMSNGVPEVTYAALKNIHDSVTQRRVPYNGVVQLHNSMAAKDGKLLITECGREEANTIKWCLEAAMKSGILRYSPVAGEGPDKTVTVSETGEYQYEVSIAGRDTAANWQGGIYSGLMDPKIGWSAADDARKQLFAKRLAGASTGTGIV